MLQSFDTPLTMFSVDGRRSQTFDRIKLHYSSEELISQIAKRKEIFQVYEGTPKIIEANDAFLPVGSRSLYDRHGVRINESCIRRFKDLAQIVKGGPDTIPIPIDCITIDEPVVYLSYLQSHWGHFLTEGISRLWAFSEYPELKQMLGVYGCNILPHKNIRDFIEALDFNVYIGGDLRQQAIRFRKIFIPLPSFSCQAEAYSVHRNVASMVLDLYLREGDRSQPSSRPVFLSRSRLEGVRTIRNQIELERILTRMGFLVVYPEALTLLSQIKLFNEYRNFAGCWGSAFYTLILSRCPETVTTHIMCRGRVNFDYLMFNSVLGNEGNYIEALSDVPGEDQVWPHLNLEIDIEEAVSYLKRLI